VVWLAGCGAGLAAGPPERPAARRVGAPPGTPDESVRPSGGTGAVCAHPSPRRPGGLPFPSN